MTTSARIVADSISPTGDRLTTMEVTYHRFVLAEMNTHRAFSRNTASSRAIPFVKFKNAVIENPAIPVEFPAEQKGMQGGSQIEFFSEANLEWISARSSAVYHAEKLAGLGVHKSVINRLLEPFQYVTSIISATDWEGFFRQRCHKDAQPEIRVAAELMKEAYNNSIPSEIDYSQWHTPYIRDEDYAEAADRYLEFCDEWDGPQYVINAISVARCARVSYLTQNNVRDIAEDFKLYQRLKDHSPPHASPFEHVARAIVPGTRFWPSNFTGFEQLRGIMRMM